MNRKKAVFFDIDWTLWDDNNDIPDSAVKAIRMLRQNGHLAFLNSGRSKGHIFDPVLLGIGFDGIVSGCGTMIEYKGETLFARYIDNDFAAYTIETVRSFGFKPVLEGGSYLYFDDDEFGMDPYAEKLKRELGSRLHSIREDWGKWDIFKLSCSTVNARTRECIDLLQPHYDFLIHNPAVLEMVPKGFHKGTGIQKVCQLLHMDIRDTIAFGDI